MAELKLVLNAEEAEIIAKLMAEQMDELGRNTTEEYRRRLWRLVVKLDRLADSKGFMADLFYTPPLWVREILWRTFAPPPVPAKKPPAVKPAAKPKPKPTVPPAATPARPPKAAVPVAS